MRQRQQVVYRRRVARANPAGTAARYRFAIPVLVVIALVGGVLALSLTARESDAATLEDLRQDRVAIDTPDGDGADRSDSEREAPRSHVTFGAHTSATQACETCHPDPSTDEIACRSCHGDTCGKDAKTVADCLACHETGTTDRWVVDE